MSLPGPVDDARRLSGKLLEKDAKPGVRDVGPVRPGHALECAIPGELAAETSFGLIRRTEKPLHLGLIHPQFKTHRLRSYRFSGGIGGIKVRTADCRDRQPNRKTNSHALSVGRFGRSLNFLTQSSPPGVPHGA